MLLLAIKTRLNHVIFYRFENAFVEVTEYAHEVNAVCLMLNKAKQDFCENNFASCAKMTIS